MKTYIIRLKDNPISEKYATECVDQAATFGIEVNYFDAINGLEYLDHLDKLKILPKYKFKKNRIGVYGCFLSHYYLWNQCVEDNIPYTILEHDGYFINPMPDDVLENFTDVLKLDNLTDANLDAVKLRWIELIGMYMNHALTVLNEEEVKAASENDADSIDEIKIIKQMLSDIPAKASDEFKQFNSLHQVISYWPGLLLPAPIFVE